MFPPFHFSFSSPSGACNWVFYIILQTTSNKNFFFFEQGGLGNEPINNISRKYFQIPCTQCVINSYRFCSLELNCHFLREAALVVPILTHLSCPCGHPHYICELPWSHLTQFMIMNLCDYIIHQALRGQRTYPWYWPLYPKYQHISWHGEDVHQMFMQWIHVEILCLGAV